MVSDPQTARVVAIIADGRGRLLAKAICLLKGRGIVQKISLTALARTELASAQTASSGRSSKTIYGGHERLLRQTLIALRAGETLAEHNNPGEATLHVLHGRIILRAGADSWSGWTGDLITVPVLPHSVEAVEDSTLLLTVVKHR